jgi:hypothetical protein
VNVTLVPAQIVLSASDEAMLTLGVTFGFTIVVIPTLVAEVGTAHVAFEVSTQVTSSPFVKVVVVYVVEFMPTSNPFNLH